MAQVQRFKVQERRTNQENSRNEALINKLQNENQNLKVRCRIYKAAIIRLYPNKQYGEKPGKN